MFSLPFLTYYVSHFLRMSTACFVASDGWIEMESFPQEDWGFYGLLLWKMGGVSAAFLSLKRNGGIFMPFISISTSYFALESNTNRHLNCSSKCS